MSLFKDFPNILNGTKIKLDSDGKYDIPEKYTNMFLIPKKVFEKLNDLKSNPIYLILKNEGNKILDFDTYTVDTPEDFLILQHEAKKRYLRDEENSDEFIYKPISIGLLQSFEPADILNKVNIVSVLNPKSQVALLTPNHNAAVLNKIKLPAPLHKIKGGKKQVRKHRGIIQTGGNAGRLKKGYKYCGKRLKNGLPKIVKVCK